MTFNYNVHYKQEKRVKISKKQISKPLLFRSTSVNSINETAINRDPDKNNL